GCFQQTGFQVKDGNCVFVVPVSGAPGSRLLERFVGADPATFAAIPPLPNAPDHALPYGRDSKNVFVGIGTWTHPVEKCDAPSFELLSADGKYSKDAAHAYYCG